MRARGREGRVGGWSRKDEGRKWREKSREGGKGRGRKRRVQEAVSTALEEMDFSRTQSRSDLGEIPCPPSCLYPGPQLGPVPEPPLWTSQLLSLPHDLLVTPSKPALTSLSSPLQPLSSLPLRGSSSQGDEHLPLPVQVLKERRGQARSCLTGSALHSPHCLDLCLSVGHLLLLF